MLADVDTGYPLLLSATDVEVRWNPQTKRLEGNHPGWWLINYPWSRIGGLASKGDDEIASTIVGAPAARVRNWYLRLPGAPTAEPAPPTGPGAMVCSTRTLPLGNTRGSMAETYLISYCNTTTSKTNPLAPSLPVLCRVSPPSQ